MSQHGFINLPHLGITIRLKLDHYVQVNLPFETV